MSTAVSNSWRATKLKFAGRVVGGGTPESGNPDYWDGFVPWLTPIDLGNEQSDAIIGSKRMLTEAGVKAAGLERLPVGSVVFSTRAPIGSVGLLACEAVTNQGCKALVPDTRKLSSRFCFYLALDSADMLQSLGLGTTFVELSTYALKNLPVSLPSLAEQRRIAGYLDEQAAKIDRLMDMRWRQMALLKEQRAALIQQAITCGLNPNAPMKDSGLPWLGEIPKHWKSTRLAHHTTRIGDGLHGTPEYVDESPYRFVNGNNLSGGAVTITATTGCVSEDEFQKHRVDLGDSTLLMSINGTVGSVACYEGELIILGKSAAYINCAKGLSRRYLFYFLQSKSAGSFFQLEATGTTIFNLSLASIRNLPIVLPSLNEQRQIVDFIEMGCAKLDNVSTSYARQLELLTEYRAALIHECVTGQRRVPEAVNA